MQTYMFGGGLIWGKRINIEGETGADAFVDDTNEWCVSTYIDIQGISSISVNAPHYTGILYLDSHYKKIERERFFGSDDSNVETTITPPQGTYYMIWGILSNTSTPSVYSKNVCFKNANTGRTLFEYKPS